MKRWSSILFWFSIPFWGYGQDGFINGGPKLAYWQIGQNKEVVIVLHGGPCVQHQYLRPEFDALSKTAKVIYYDQRGCGKSERSNSYTWQDHVTDLKRLIQTLAKDRKVFLAGSSWGSLLAILYTYTHPEDIKGLILSGTVPWNGEEKLYERDSSLAKRPIKVLKGSLGELGIVTRQSPNGQIQQDTVSISREYEMTSGLPAYETSISMISAPKAERLKQIGAPILLFNGTKSVKFDGANEYLKLFPHIEVQTISDAGHDPWLRDPNLFFSISNEFIRNTSK
ncbi:alpha/beta fold hydrolase [Larkinella insperata]|uniref:Alpha/beta fold hydrolase n=1 Tax=Larkinella insperata TaxID=332158 RepID=A0ABW3QEQ7_9BACT